MITFGGFGSNSSGGGSTPTGTANSLALFGPAGTLTTDSGATFDGTGASLIANIRTIKLGIPIVPSVLLNYAGAGISINRDGPLVWSGIADATGTPDLGLARASTGVLKVTDGSTGAGRLLVADGDQDHPFIAPVSSPTTGFSYAGFPGALNFGLGSGAPWLVMHSSANNVGYGGFTMGYNAVLAIGNGGPATADTYLTRGGAAATWQLGNGKNAAPVANTLIVGESSRPGTDTNVAGGKGTLTPGNGTGTGGGGDFSIRVGVDGATGSAVNSLQTRYYAVAKRKLLTLGSATAFVRVDFPALSSVTVAIGYNVIVTDSAATVNVKTNGGRYYIHAYRLAAGNAVAGAVVETGDGGAQSAGNTLADAFTVTGDANGIIVSQNVTVGTGLTAPTAGYMSYTVEAHGSGSITVTTQ